MFSHRRREAKWTGAGHPMESAARDPWYEVHAAATAFELPVGYTRNDVYAAYRRLARKAHPDVGGTHDAFQTLVAQRDLLLKARER